MPSYHLHLEGQVQGVGFRPFVYRLAQKLQLKGWVSNGIDGLHIAIAGNNANTKAFYTEILQRPPLNARIVRHTFEPVPEADYPDFQIAESSSEGQPNLIITPDLGLCPQCRKEILETGNRRYGYAFTTCTNCGPRYSIINTLPYDRHQTTMRSFEQCDPCLEEYNNPTDRRYYSQTNSCTSCGIELVLLNNQGKLILKNQDVILRLMCVGLSHGKIIGLKGIGGYLLLTDATNEQAIERLRARKHRSAKPFALLYPNLEQIKEDAELSAEEEESLISIEAPIVLLRHKQHAHHKLSLGQIAPGGLNRMGVMLPYTPLLELLVKKWGKPVIATSGNMSGSPIYFEDKDAIAHLSSVADFFVTNSRSIVVPQDDSVIQFTREKKQKVVLRRSRGLAPTFLPNVLQEEQQTCLAMGGELKSSFALTHQGNLYISQYLGDLEDFQTQTSYHHTLHHLLQLFNASPQKILIDKHPGYFASAAGRKLAQTLDIPFLEIQHHKAHFSAVLAENELLHSQEPVLGVIWDGTGWGEDGAIWGGEFFRYSDYRFDRVANLHYIDHLLADKFSREPRLCALSLCKNIPAAAELLRPKFTEKEWVLYNKLLSTPGQLQTSSMGRFFDGVASLLGLLDKASYEGEAALHLETLASSTTVIPLHLTAQWSPGEEFSLNHFMSILVSEILRGTSREAIAYSVHVNLVRWIARVATREKIEKIAFSGGVFQNGLLIDLIHKMLGDTHKLYFHKQLSPNDENIGFGQLAYNLVQQHQKITAKHHAEECDLITT